jgi:hypothetical protein
VIRIKKIKWKANAKIDHVFDAEAVLQELWDCDPFTFPKIESTDLWVTYPRYVDQWT